MMSSLLLLLKLLIVLFSTFSSEFTEEFAKVCTEIATEATTYAETATETTTCYAETTAEATTYTETAAEATTGTIEKNFSIELGNGNFGSVSVSINYDYVNSMYNLLNQFRVQNGLSPLSTDVESTNAAILRAAENAYLACVNGDINAIAHTRPNSESFSSLGGIHENALAGPSINIPAEETIRLFTTSEPHYYTMICNDATKVGVGAVFFVLPTTGETIVSVIQIYY